VLAAIWRLAVPGAFALVVWPLLLIPVASVDAPQVTLQLPATPVRRHASPHRKPPSAPLPASAVDVASHKTGPLPAAPAAALSASKPLVNKLPVDTPPVNKPPVNKPLVAAPVADKLREDDPMSGQSLAAEPAPIPGILPVAKPVEEHTPGGVRLVSHTEQEMPLRQPERLAAYSAPEMLPPPETAPAPLIDPAPGEYIEADNAEPGAEEQPGNAVDSTVVVEENVVPLTPLFGSALGLEAQVLDPGDGSGCGCGSCETCDCAPCIDACSKPGQLLSFFEPTCGPGIGLQRVGLAPFELDVTEPFNHFDIQVNPVFGFSPPDTAEYFWPKSANSVQAVEQSVNYQDLRFRMEVGNDLISNITELPLRFLDPQINPNTSGLADMNTAVKTRLFKGASLNISQIVRTYLNTGAVTHGLSSGHVSLEPGLLLRYEWDQRTFLFSEVKFWVPLGGDPAHSGEILKYGGGISHLWIDNDRFAAIPVFEFVAWNILDGEQTLPPSQQPVPGGAATRSLDGDVIFNLFPGIRFTFKGGENFDLFELGVNGGVAVSSQRWYNGQMRFEGRWMF